MQKSVLCLLLAASLLSGCATDPYTGESKVSKTAWGAGIGTAVAPAWALWSAVKRAR